MTRTPTPGDAKAEAFASFVVPEIDVLLRVARTLVPRPADAEDLVQDTLLRAYRSIETFDGRHPRAWLLTIMRNAQVNRTRKQRPQLLDDPDVDHARPDGRQTDASAEAVALETGFDAAVIAALESLPPLFRQVIELVDVAGLTYAEAAEAAGVPIGTVMSRLHRARARIREQLAVAGLAPKRQSR